MPMDEEREFQLALEVPERCREALEKGIARLFREPEGAVAPLSLGAAEGPSGHATGAEGLIPPEPSHHVIR